MNGDQLGGILRAVLPAIGAYIAAKGWLPIGTVNEIGGAIITAAVAFWSFKTNAPAAMISSVAANPEVSKIVTTPSVAAADPSSKVTSS